MSKSVTRKFLNVFLSCIGFCILLCLPSDLKATELVSNGSLEADNSLWGQNADLGNGLRVDRLNNSEQDLTDWTIVMIDGQMEWMLHDGSLPAYDGSYSLELIGAVGSPGNRNYGRIYQALTTVSGVQYRLSVWLKPRSSTASNNDILANIRNASSSGTIIATDTFSPGSGSDSAAWENHTLDFVASSTTTYISFEVPAEPIAPQAGQGSLVDNISVTSLMPVFTSTSANYPYDVSGDNLKAIPGQNMVIEWGLKNAGGPPDSGFTMATSVNSNLAFKIGSLTFEDGCEVANVNGAGGVPSSTCVSINNSGLTLGTVEYSNVGESGPWTYTPSADFSDPDGSYDNDVRGIRVTPGGTMNDGSSSPVGFRIYYQGQIK